VLQLLRTSAQRAVRTCPQRFARPEPVAKAPLLPSARKVCESVAVYLCVACVWRYKKRYKEGRLPNAQLSLPASSAGSDTSWPRQRRFRPTSTSHPCPPLLRAPVHARRMSARSIFLWSSPSPLIPLFTTATHSPFVVMHASIIEVCGGEGVDTPYRTPARRKKGDRTCVLAYT
jgi:hypothetical protein